MIGLRGVSSVGEHSTSRPLVGTVGHLALLAWSIGIVFLLPQRYIPLTAGGVLTIGAIFYPIIFRRLLRWRWAGFFCVLILPNLLWLSQSDRVIAGVPVSVEGLIVGLRMALRAVVVLLALDIFAAAVDIAEIAGLLERIGLKGLGFSMGVAVNLLPSLRQSGTHAWHSLRMRGGFRAQRWRGLRFLLITVVTNALRRAEEIALAAETRAFSPEHAQALPIKVGRLDWVIAGAGIVSFVGVVLLLRS